METLKWVPDQEMHHGANVREPLAQSFTFAEFPMRGITFKYPPESLKREWYEVKRNQEVVPRQEAFLRGDIFEGSFWTAPGWYSKADYEFQIWSVKLRIGRSWVDRFEEPSIRIWCDLRPQGEIHPDTVIRGLWAKKTSTTPLVSIGRSSSFAMLPDWLACCRWPRQHSRSAEWKAKTSTSSVIAGTSTRHRARTETRHGEAWQKRSMINGQLIKRRSPTMCNCLHRRCLLLSRHGDIRTLRFDLASRSVAFERTMRKRAGPGSRWTGMPTKVFLVLPGWSTG